MTGGDGAEGAVSVVWFRDDLRTADHPALAAALAAGPAVGLFVLDEASPGVRPLGGAARWWLHHALQELGERLAGLGVPLILRRGPAAREVADVVRALAAGRRGAGPGRAVGLHFNERHGGPERAVDAEATRELRTTGVAVHAHRALLLHDPATLLTSTGGHYRVFTPFSRAVVDRAGGGFRRPEGVPRPAAGTIPPAPSPVPAARDTVRAGASSDGPPSCSAAPAGEPARLPRSDALADWGLDARGAAWTRGLDEAWRPGESAALERLDQVRAGGLAAYGAERDRPDLDGTSRLSPALRWGHVSPHQLWWAVEESRAAADDAGSAAQLQRQLLWREFSWHQLHHEPRLPTENLRPEFDAFDWARAGDGPGEAAAFSAWRRGETGFAMVDAGMRQLWRTGWMHNRARMVTASFLVKNLGLHWRDGEAWFWDTLVDADAASNPVNWQWVAGCGNDAAPYFRVLNPERQRARFDPAGRYAARFAPEVRDPVVDLAESRAATLEAHARMRAARG
ncbi:cryptochrome/photolyase family protein [Zafaria sp. J156]|uniref:cryptochrome/photolyase family protein n=1 Tax=Zafaria sp. J156 TaxID=3116490 RepID=UPI002E7AA118|nr:deoxyribodipyrimidine photo-lyase [Zafaria sp. J156]MEE1620940.1 deoxyribodipyrimidine photo-lyase [Zafaria sp. J156]